MTILEPGRLIDSRFLLDRFVGEGGMGAVWAAHHVVTGKQVALKILKGSGDEHRRRFVQEARVAAAIRHPNVVDIHDVVELVDGRPVLVMDLLEGEPLSSALAVRGVLSLAELSPIMLAVLSGVGAAHAVGIVHRDLKPENVFLAKGISGEVQIKVLDFGIAKLTELSSAIRHTAALTQTGSVLGTPMYMAPEQVFGEKTIDHRADLWSLGVVMYECLTGDCPIQGDNVGQIFKSISQRTFPSIRERAPSLVPGVADLIDSMLAIDPKDRPSSARIVAERLAFHAGLPPPEIAEPRWLPGSNRGVVADPMAPTEANRAPAPNGLLRRWRVVLGLSAGTALSILGWRFSAGARPADAPPIATAELALEPTAIASVTALDEPRPSTSEVRASPAPTETSSSAQRVASETKRSAAPRTAAPSAPAKPTTGPGGIHAASPY